MDFTGYLGETFFASRIAPMALVVNGLVAGYLVLERRSAFRSVHESSRTVIASMQDVVQRLQPLEASAARIGALFEGFEGDRFAEIRLIYGLRNLSTLTGNHEINASQAQVFDLWADGLREATTFFAFNYSSAEEVWGTKGWAFNMAHSLQLARVHGGCTIRRVFVIDTHAEYETLKALMLAQQGVGMQVRWLFMSQIRSNPVLSKLLEEIGSSDFVAIDKDMLFRVALDEKRRMQSGCLLRNREIHQKALRVFQEAFKMGSLPSRAPSKADGAEASKDIASRR